jgi:hypothetical protein
MYFIYIILYYILAYIQHNGDVSLENSKDVFNGADYNVLLRKNIDICMNAESTKCGMCSRAYIHCKQ